MTFDSLTFLVFFCVVVAVYYLPLSWTARKTHLLLASYLFYAAWNPPFVALLWISTVVDWFAARRIHGATATGRRKLWLAVSLSTNLGLLGVFKYGEFLLAEFTRLAAAMGIAYQAPEVDIILPIGISFYTFQTLSYTLDVYRGTLKPAEQFLDFALFVTFFPQLVAGPIVRAADFLPQCLRRPRVTADQFAFGLALLTLGLFQKSVLADYLLAPVVDRVFESFATAGFLAAWTGTLAFSGQIFLDFAGYSTCAIGCALCLGFVLPENFRSPYAAIGFSDFWRRWHISLSRWLRDYLYIALGGNRSGRWKTRRNLILTMLLGGLWHGAAWRFVVWGGLHGAYLALERLLQHAWGGLSVWKSATGRALLAIATYLLVCLAWVPFRAESLHASITLLKQMFGSGLPATPLLIDARAEAALLLVFAMLAGQWLCRERSFGDRLQHMPQWLRVPIFAGMIFALLAVPADDRAFIYFQF